MSQRQLQGLKVMALVEAGKTKEGIKAKVLKLSRKVYGEFNDQHFTEKLADEEGIEVSRETVREIRQGAGMVRSGSGGARSTGSVGNAKLRRTGWAFGMAGPTPGSGHIFLCAV